MKLTKELVKKLPEALKYIGGCGILSCKDCPADLFRDFDPEKEGYCDEGVREAARIFIQSYLDAVFEENE